MSWKTARRSFYYQGAPEPDDPVLEKGKVALLVIDVQNTYLERPDPATLSGEELARYHPRLKALSISSCPVVSLTKKPSILSLTPRSNIAAKWARSRRTRVKLSAKRCQSSLRCLTSCRLSVR